MSSEGNETDDGMEVESMAGWVQGRPHRQCCLLHGGVVRRLVQSVGVAREVVWSIIAYTSSEGFVL